MSLGRRFIVAADRVADIDPVLRREEEVRKMQSHLPNEPANLMGRRFRHGPAPRLSRAFVHR